LLWRQLPKPTGSELIHNQERFPSSLNAFEPVVIDFAGSVVVRDRVGVVRRSHD
jgi:hypothetical protein